MVSLHRAVDLFVPRRCLLCGQSLVMNWGAVHEVDVPVCPACIERLRPITGERCRSCGRPLISEIDRCTSCRARNAAFAGHRSAFVYEGDAKRLVHRFKFEGERTLAPLFASVLAGLVGKRAGSLIVPVPGRPSSVRKRGWDQMREIGKWLARFLQCPCSPVLERANGASQKTLSYDERMRNLHGMVAISARRSESAIRGADVVLIDDVFTTGATVAECAEVLQRAGADRVRALTVAMDL